MLNIGLDLHVHTTQLYLLAETPQLPPSPLQFFGAHIRGRYWRIGQPR
jgi:hypothetical protein